MGTSIIIPGSAASTHYQVLNLTPSLLDAQHDPSTLIRKAYRRALLQNHPDKALPSPSFSSSSVNTPQSSNTTTPKEKYTIDQITRAFTVLASPRDRADYDTSLRLSRSAETASGLEGGRFQTGVENVDLDDLDFDQGKESWYRPCRCGNERSYCFTEDDLIEVEEEGELMVGCLDCSLWLRVHFAVA
ncbi:hypothetical protein N3K66_001235 [Trichothecium roseum]|uniref:Uncharacterized protein n=1 Tax=Trichothecium roseum TaxID=47278 RepID=A0ACC0VE16_9HYPO|nr:hypothetical protein N3K66_001235 [Trichothecium roseum]